MRAETCRALGLQPRSDGRALTLGGLLQVQGVDLDAISAALPGLRELPREALRQVAIDARYAPYIAREARAVESLGRDEQHEIPREFDYLSIPGLSNELKEKLTRTRPVTLAQANRIEGMTPAALTLILLRTRARRAA
jgi:tRNA uridine 5-carboxymethylaminomethyl modification enzyme